MPHEQLDRILLAELKTLELVGRLKGRESVTNAVLPARGGRGPRVLIESEGDKEFLRMNSNGYLGMSLRAEVIAAEECASRRYGVGPGAVRFISGTSAPHIELERALAAFHGRESAMIFSSAYAAVMGVLPSLITSETAVISDELNHNSIINGIRLARPRERRVYRHLDVAELEDHLAELTGKCRRVIVVTDGVFSMRGDHAPLAHLMALSDKYDAAFPENVIVVVDDSHGVGAFGARGRGTEEYTGNHHADLLVATLGKAFGVNGGYVAGSSTVIEYMRETSAFYIYSNPITPGEAAAAQAAVTLLDGPVGRALLERLGQLKARFKRGLQEIGLEAVPGEHPIVFLMVRDSRRTAELVRHLRGHGILATGMGHPIVPRGDEGIRFQINADHTPADIDQVLEALRDFAYSVRG